MEEAEFMHSIPKYGSHCGKYYELVRDEKDKYGFWRANSFDLGNDERLPNLKHNDLINPIKERLEPLTKRQFFNLKKEALRKIFKDIPEDGPFVNEDSAKPPAQEPVLAPEPVITHPSTIDKAVKIWNYLTTTKV